VLATFDLSRFMGASLTMIDRHYGHLARDGRQHAVALLDALAADGRAWTFGGRRNRHRKPAQLQHRIRDPRRRLTGAGRPDRRPQRDFRHGGCLVPFFDDALGQYMNRIFGEVDAFVHQVFARHLVDLRCQQPG